MKRFFTYLGLSAIGFAAAFAAPISPEEALQRVQESNLTPTSLPATRAAAPALKKTFKDKEGKAALYIFDNSNQRGFMLVSADDATVPLLGYSDTNSFDPDNIPPALEYWISEYQRQIEFARENGIETRSDVESRSITLPSSWTTINPIVTTHWDQNAPFNDLCPQDPQVKKNSYTGCVATAMAQAMKYFNYPAQGTGTISYKCPAPINKTLSLDLSSFSFDWNNMINDYSGSNYSSAQATAVAQLMEACGYSVSMYYSAQGNGSAAAGGVVGTALVNYFGYDQGIRYFSRNDYTYTQWAQMLYDNLKNIGPVVYDGQGSAGGHCWICDGYSNGYFHFNWGWGGLSDGYYLLDALSPSSLGAGGGAGNFNYDQAAIFKIQPNKNSGTPQREMVMYGNFTGTLNGTLLTIEPVGGDMPGWSYQGLNTLEVIIGVGVVKADTPDATPSFYKEMNGNKWNLNGGNYIPAVPEAYVGSTTQKVPIQVNLNAMNLTAGVKYKVITAYQANNVWDTIDANVGYSNYFYITKTGSTYSIENIPPMEFEGTSASLDTDLYYQKPAKFSATLTNSNNTELTRSVAVALINSNGRLAFISDPVMASIAPGQTSSISLTSNLTRQSGISVVTKATDFTLGLYDTENKELFYTSSTKVTMQPAPAAAQFTISTYVADTKTAQQGGLTYYLIENARNFNVVTTLNVTSGYFTDPLTVGIYTPSTNNQAILTSSFPIIDFALMNAGQSNTWTTNCDIPDAKVSSADSTDGLYFMGIMGAGNKLISGSPLNIVLQIEGIGSPVGIESIFGANEEITFLVDRVSHSLNVIGGTDGIANVEAYYLNGMKAPIQVYMDGDNAFANLSELGKGVVVVTAVDRAGNRKSIKLAL